MDKVKSFCDHCGTAYQVNSSMIGSQGRCYVCQAFFIYKPAEQPADPPAQPQKPSWPPTPPAGAYGAQPTAAWPGQQSPASSSPNQASTAGTTQRPVTPKLNPQSPRPPQMNAPPDGGNAGGVRTQPSVQGQRSPSLAMSAASLPIAKDEGWGKSLVINTRCPRCGFNFPVARTYIDKSVGCPECKKPFFVAENYGWLEDPNGTAFSRLISHPRFFYILGGFFVLLIVLNISIPILLNTWAEYSLKNAMMDVYSPDEYDIALTAIQKKDIFRHKTPDGTKLCSRSAVVTVNHLNSGMAFPRIMCQSGGDWTPDFAQTIADRVAYEGLDNPFAQKPFDIGDMISGVANMGAVNWKDTFAKSPEEILAYEAKMIAERSGPAISAMTKLGHDEAGDKSWEDVYYNGYEKDGYLGTSTSTIDDYDELPIFFGFFDQEPDLDLVYKAHAVMYPDQVDELLNRGLISERP